MFTQRNNSDIIAILCSASCFSTYVAYFKLYSNQVYFSNKNKIKILKPSLAFFLNDFTTLEYSLNINLVANLNIILVFSS